MQTKTINCRMCGGDRPSNGSMCLGCGTDVQKATAPAPRNYRPRCPRCWGYRSTVLYKDRYSCRDCGSVFERLESGVLDTRPEVAAEKRERLAAAEARRERHIKRRAM